MMECQCWYLHLYMSINIIPFNILASMHVIVVFSRARFEFQNFSLEFCCAALKRSFAVQTIKVILFTVSDVNVRK